MKDKFKSLGKRIVALLLSVLTVTMMFPLSAFAATENLGAVSDMKKLDISVSKHYGHEVHTTKKAVQLIRFSVLNTAQHRRVRHILKAKKLWQVTQQLKLQSGYLQDIILNTATQ